MADFDIVPDGSPVETPEAGAAAAYEGIPATTGQALGAEALSTMSSAMRVGEQGQYQGSGWFSRFLYGATTNAALSDGAIPQDEIPGAGTVPAPLLSPNEYNAKYAPIGNDGKPVSLGTDPLPDPVAKLIGEAKTDEIKRENILSRYQGAHSWPTNFAIGTLGFMLDPLRASTAFVPEIGEEAILARVGTGLAGRTAARLGAGALGGVAAGAGVAGLEYGLGTQEASDYSLREAFRDMAFGAAGFAIGHAAFGGAGEALRYAFPKREELPGAVPAPLIPPTAVPPTVEPLGEAAAPILEADAQTQHAAIGTAVAQLAEGRPVEVEPYFYRPPQAETAVGLALRPTERAEIGMAGSVEEQARRIAPEVFAEYDPLARRAEELRQQIAAPEAVIDQRIAEAQARVEAAQQDQQLPTDIAPEEAQKLIAARTAEHDQAAQELNALQAGRQALADGLANQARTELTQTVEPRLRDLAPALSAATRNAEAIRAAGQVNRMVAMGPREFPDPASLVTAQQTLYREGFAPGISGDDLRTASAAIYEPKAEAPIAEETAAGTQAAAGEGEAAQQAHPVTAETTEEAGATGPGEQPRAVDPEAAALLARADQFGPELLPEERAEIETARAGLDTAQRISDAMDEAAACLTEGGL